MKRIIRAEDKKAIENARMYLKILLKSSDPNLVVRASLAMQALNLRNPTPTPSDFNFDPEN